MRKIFILAIFCAGIFAFDETEIYQKAQDYENKGDYENAMKLYKQIAQIRFQKPKNVEISTQISNDSKISVDKALPQNSYKILSKDDVEHKSESKYAQDDKLFDISVYEPFYFLGSYDFSDKDGRKNGEVKFGFGLEMPIVYDLFGLNEKIVFAYTQRAWWQVDLDSAPFRETNYQPEIFIQIPFENSIKYVQFGALHESNGKDGEVSRSWNKLYAQAAFKMSNFTFTPRVWRAFLTDDNNDISDYIGYGEFNFNYEIGEHELHAKWRNNLKFDENRGAIELGWFFPLYGNFKGYVQYFSGYGESLVDYSKSVDKISFGFAYK